MKKICLILIFTAFAAIALSQSDKIMAKPFHIEILNPHNKVIEKNIFILPAEQLPNGLTQYKYCVEYDFVRYPVQESYDLLHNKTFITCFDIGKTKPEVPTAILKYGSNPEFPEKALPILNQKVASEYGIVYNFLQNKVSITEAPADEEVITIGEIRRQKRISMTINCIDYQVNATKQVSDDIGSSLSHQEMKFDRKIEDFNVGISKNKESVFLKKIIKDKNWSYIASFGKVGNDNYARAIIFKTKFINKIKADKSYNSLYFDKSDYFDFYYIILSEKEYETLKSPKDFDNYLDKIIDNLNNPVVFGKAE
jgi:hypothetical protein